MWGLLEGQLLDRGGLLLLLGREKTPHLWGGHCVPRAIPGLDNEASLGHGREGVIICLP